MYSAWAKMANLDIPIKLYAEIEAAAAKLGMTLEAYVTEAILRGLKGSTSE